MPVQSRWSAGEAEGTLGESPEDSERAADSAGGRGEGATGRDVAGEGFGDW